MPEPTPAPRPQDVPDELLETAARTLMESPSARAGLVAVLADHERRVWAQVAAEYRAAADAADAGHAVQLAQVLWNAYGAYDGPFVVADPRRIAALAYRHLADRLTEETP